MCDPKMNRFLERIKDLETSIIKHFHEEHLAGDGPEIDRWKRKVKELEGENAKLSGKLALVRTLTEELKDMNARLEKNIAKLLRG